MHCFIISAVPVNLLSKPEHKLLCTYLSSVNAFHWKSIDATEVGLGNHMARHSGPLAPRGIDMYCQTFVSYKLPVKMTDGMFFIAGTDLQDVVENSDIRK